MSRRGWINLPLGIFLFLVSALFFSTTSYSADGMVWQFGEGGDPANGGRMVAHLSYGVPETDNSQVQISCSQPESGAVELSAVFGADIGDQINDAGVELRFSGGGFSRDVPGKITGAGAEVGLTGVKLDAGIDDPLWEAFAQKASLDYLVPGYSAAKLELKSGHRQIKNFVEACEAYGASEPAKVADAQAETGKVELAAGPSAGSDVPEKEAFDAAKELGTIEAWEAFLENYPEGFRADLARAYLKRIGEDGAGSSTAPPAPATAAAPPAPVPADISLAMTSQGACTGGRNCSVTVTATNAGGEPFSGDLTIATSLAPGGAELQGSGTPPFSCEGVGGGAICSTGAANIAPGQSTAIPMTFTLPRNAGGQVTTCASIAWGGVPSALGALEVQRKLNELGFNAGPADGQPGRQTVGAIKAFQQASGIQETGEIDLPLLLALFAPGGPGDGDPTNDQACAGAAVTSAPPLPAAYTGPPAPNCPLGQVVKSNGQCGCPSSVPVWTGTSCIPRVTRNCKGGTYYNKSQKLCLCPSRKPHWYNGRCHAAFDECPGDSVRVGDKCLKENDPGFAARPRPNRPQFGGGCPANTTRIGNSCIAVNLAPLFGFGKKTKGGRGGRPGNQTFGGGGQTGTQQGGPVKCPAGQTFSGAFGCVKLADPKGLPQPCPKNHFWSNGKCQLANTVPTSPPPPPPPPIVKGGGNNTQLGGQPKCPAGEILSLWGCVKGPVPNCPPGVLHQVTADRRVICDTNQGPQPNPNPPPPPKLQKGVGQAAGQQGGGQAGKCPPGTVRVSNGVCALKQDKCPANTIRNADGTCRYIQQQKPLTTQKQSACLPGAIRYSKGGKCVVGKCPANATRSSDGTCVYGLKPNPKAQQAAPKTVIKCIGGQPAGNGCNCPPGQSAQLVVSKLDSSGNRTRTFQCQGTQAQPPKQLQNAKPCSGGRVRLANGKCRCAAGQQYIFGQCVNAQQNQTQRRGGGQQQQQLTPQQQQIQQGIQQLNKILSDRRLKRDVVHVATRADGLKLYSFRYLWDDTPYVGVMAQDLAQDPARADAISVHPSGYYMVDYAALSLSMVTLREWNSARP